jgi:hypothetical protein
MRIRLKHIFYRDVRARKQLELFLLSAVTSLLLVRFYLQLTGYPQIGSGGLHIAHMLWGGLLMLVSLVLTFSFMGTRVQRTAAVFGGAGFGIFIDELGKFITRDNNYFYRPTVGIIYVIFIILYLTFNFLSRRRTYSSREYQLNALVAMEEAIVRDMDPLEKQRVVTLLQAADQSDPITKILQHSLQRLPTVPKPRPGKLAVFLNALRQRYDTLWQKRDTNVGVRIFFVLEPLFFVGVWAVTNNVDSLTDALRGQGSFNAQLAVGQLVSSLVAVGFAVWGVLLLRRSPSSAYEQFRRATVVNILLTQVFMFLRLQFEALPGFLFNLALLGWIDYVIHHRRKLRLTND